MKNEVITTNGHRCITYGIVAMLSMHVLTMAAIIVAMRFFDVEVRSQPQRLISRLDREISG